MKRQPFDSEARVLRGLLVLTLLLTLAAAIDFLRAPWQAGVLFTSAEWRVVLGAFLLLLGVQAGLLGLSFRRGAEQLLTWSRRAVRFFARLGRLNWALFVLGIAGFGFLIFWPISGVYLLNPFVRVLLFWLVTVAGMLFLRAGGLARPWYELLAGALLIAAAGVKLAEYAPQISNNPFSLDWSEASRYYYASLYFAQRVYGLDIPPTTLHPTRYLMQAVPFLLGSPPLWVHRAWQVFLWLATTGLTVFLVARRLAIPDRFKRLLFLVWSALYLLLAPVYYHLLIPVIVVLWGYRSERWARNLAVVVLASLWAGVSRINWFPVPALLAGLLYLLESRVESKSIVRYLAPPAVWSAAGLLAAFGAQAAYIVWTGRPAEQFGSSFSSDLLWYRLWPNATYPLGILLSALLTAAPLLLVLVYSVRARPGAYHRLRLVGVAGVLAVLFAGGVLVSLKIGGGSNLHNLDAFLVTLLIGAAYFYWDRVIPDRPVAVFSQPLAQFGAGLALVLVVYATVMSGQFSRRPTAYQISQGIKIIQEHADRSLQQGKEVLLISERQLLTFNELTGVPLVAPFEKVFLMEMVMAGNQPYLRAFYDDLRAQRYGLIINDPATINYLGREATFGEENDLWVERVARYLLCYYEPVDQIRSVGAQLLTPRSEPLDCPVEP